jgi:hypothetical protein
MLFRQATGFSAYEGMGQLQYLTQACIESEVKTACWATVPSRQSGGHLQALTVCEQTR